MTLTAVLFVGGLSTRMGRDKALLQVAGEPLWSRQLRLLGELQPDRISISCRSTPGWCPRGIDVIEDEMPSRGPLSGLTRSLAMLKTSHLLVLAIDLPRMDSTVLREIWNAAGQGCGVVPVGEDYFEPLCAVYPVEALQRAREALEAGNLSLQNLAGALVREKRVAPWRIPAAFRPAFLNVNEPSDLGF